MKIIVLKQDNRRYKVAIHFTTPAGNNSVGNSWKDCALAAGIIGTTILEVGTAPGEITQVEHDAITAGTTVEIVKVIAPGSNPTNASVLALCNTLISEWQAGVGDTLKYYGHVIEAA